MAKKRGMIVVNYYILDFVHAQSLAVESFLHSNRSDCQA